MISGSACDRNKGTFSEQLTAEVYSNWFGESTTLITPSQYTVYVGKGSRYGCRSECKSFHHYIVIGLPQKRGIIVGFIFERSSCSGEQLATRSDVSLYTHSLADLEFQGRITFALDILATLATSVAAEMGEYCLFCSNCQHFCKRFLERTVDNSAYQPTVSQHQCHCSKRRR